MYQRKDNEEIGSAHAGRFWPVPDSSPHPSKRLKVLILGSEHQEHFLSILAANVQQWGYEARMLPQHEGARGGSDQTAELEGDVLLYDLDVPFHRSVLLASQVGEEVSLADVYRTGSGQRRPRVRLIIALSSRSVSRFTLEQVGAVALLNKPFQMGRLQRYLRVFQELVCDEPADSGEERTSWRQATGNALEQGAQEELNRSVRVLVVEDHPRVADTIRQCLECEPGYDIRIASDGLDALEQYVTWRPQCIVTDLLLPYMDGYQVMRALSATSTRELPAFVVLSALTQRELPESHVYPHRNSVVFIDKPFQIENLLDAVEQALAS